MTAHEIKQEFARRYFLWALGEAAAEARRGFSGFSWIESAPVFHFFRFIEMERVDCESLLELLVKAAHEFGRGRDNQLSQEEIKLLSRYTGRQPSQRDFPGWASGVATPKYLENVERELQGAPQCSAEAVLQLLGRKLVGCELRSGRVRQQTIVGQWVIETQFWSDPRVKRLEYTHRIFSSGNEHTRCVLSRSELGGHGMSVLEWLGVAQHTMWTSLFSLSAEQLAFRVSELAEKYLAAANQLLQGLSPPQRP